MLRKIILSALCVSALFARGGFVEDRGEHYGQWGGDRHERPEHRVMSVARAKQMRDNTKVMLDGKIKERLHDDDYLFVDKHGDKIVVEIDEDKFDNWRIDRHTLVRVYGEVDIDDGRKKIDVDEIRVLR